MKCQEVCDKVLKGKRLSQHTKVNYQTAFNSLMKVTDEFPRKSSVINEWIAGLEGYSDESVKLYFTIIREAGRYMKLHYSLPNPCLKCEVPSVKKKRRRYFTADEFIRLVSVCRDELSRDLVLGLMDSTARIGEMAKVKSCDVGEGFLDVEGKTGQRRYRLDVELCRRFKALAGGDDEYVFKDGNGGFISAQALSLRIRRLAIKAGLGNRKVGAHTLRHTAGSLVARYTRSDMAVKALLQHDAITSSMAYVHDADEAIQQDISPLQLALGEASKAKETQVKMLPVAGGEDSLGSEFVEIEGETADDGLEELMREVADGVSVRPLLKDMDLRLVRSALIEYARVDELKRGSCIGLYNRLLRKVK